MSPAYHNPRNRRTSVVDPPPTPAESRERASGAYLCPTCGMRFHDIGNAERCCLELRALEASREGAPHRGFHRPRPDQRHDPISGRILPAWMRKVGG